MKCMSLSLQGLTIWKGSKYGRQELVTDVSLEIPKGKIVGIVGESGSGKSLTMKSILGILPENLGNSYSSFQYKGQVVDLGQSLPIAMIFQDPMTSLNPLRTIGFHLEEVLARFQPGLAKDEREQTILSMLYRVGIANPEERLHQFPFEFSGGMRQRIMIAMALLAKPEVLIADEPTTALDVTIQAQILALLKELQESLDLTVVIVSHDFGVIAGLCDSVVVMRQGQVVEQGTVEDIFYRPLHFYTQSLLQAAQLDVSVDSEAEEPRQTELVAVSETHFVRRELTHG
ncbi:TPA: ABC transporter ATP-binding protein [Streptococcus suis]|nr:ABC transporter ATP-binding protein [Streptococcus suis]